MKARVAHLSLPRAGERENGDAVFVRKDDRELMLAVVDGLGHGPSAAEVARAAIQKLATVTADLPMLDVMLSLHHALMGTIGASATVCAIRGRQLEACAVGNVQLATFGCSVPLVPSAGVLGRRVATFRVCRCEIPARSWLALFSDGISNRLRLARATELSPEAACQSFLAQFRKREDDATILIASMEE